MSDNVTGFCYKNDTIHASRLCRIDKTFGYSREQRRTDVSLRSVEPRRGDNSLRYVTPPPEERAEWLEESTSFQTKGGAGSQCDLLREGCLAKGGCPEV
jgi:hypothetical protein